MKKGMNLLLGAVLLGTSSMASAEMGIGVKAGTLGYGAEFTLGMTESINARLGLNTYSYSDTEKQGDVNYDMDLSWKTTGAFVDWHPFKGSFRVTLGYIQNNNEIDLDAKPSGSYDIGDSTYTAAQVGTLTGNVDFDNGLFYGIGWGNAGDGKGLGFIFEAGILQQSSEVDLKCRGGALCNDAGFLADLRKEEKKAQDDLDDFDQYPVISLGISYSF